MSSLLVYLLFALAAGAQAASPAISGSLVRGLIVDRSTGAPIPGAVVSLLPASPTASARVSLRSLMNPTNTDGVFEIRNVPRGRWRIQVQKEGYITLNASNLPIVLDVAGAVVTAPDIRLDRGGAIFGRVLDARGSPMSRVMVLSIRQIRSSDGKVRMTGGSSGQTNDLGEFRLAGLADGQYYVAAVPASNMVNPLTGGPARAPLARTDVATVYPGVADIADGSLVNVNSGVVTTGIEFTMLSVDAHQVSGIVIDAGGRPVAGAVVQLGQVRQPLTALVHQGAPSAMDGAFVITNVPPGTYVARAAVPLVSRTANGGLSSSLSVDAAARPGSTEVVVERDVAGVRVVVSKR